MNTCKCGWDRGGVGEFTMSSFPRLAERLEMAYVVSTVEASAR